LVVKKVVQRVDCWVSLSVEQMADQRVDYWVDLKVEMRVSQ
jgi:hypothetical protein